VDSATWLNVGLVLAFVLVGGLFAGTEIALVSLRDSQIDQLARRGRRGARVAKMARNPNRFLAAVQIGVTVAGFFSAAYGASTLAEDLAPTLERIGLSATAAESLSVAALTLVIAYLSLVLGELVPKRFALQRSAGVSLAVAPTLDRFATVMRPVIWLLSVSTNAVVRLLGGNPSARSEEMSEEELRDLVAGHESLEDDERRILHDVFDAGDRTVAEVMRPRGDVTFVAASMPVATARNLVRDSPYSRYPVTGEDFDDVLGFLHVRDLLEPPTNLHVRDLVREIRHVPATARVLPTLSSMRSQRQHIAIVVDEYGGTDGIVTLEDLIEELIGEITDEFDTAPAPRGTPGDAVSIEGGTTIDEFAELTGIELPDGSYETVAGYVLSRLGRLGRDGDTVDLGNTTLVVDEATDRRIRRIRVVPTTAADDDGG
jgi:putative hemolysin